MEEDEKAMLFIRVYLIPFLISYIMHFMYVRGCKMYFVALA